MASKMNVPSQLLSMDENNLAFCKLGSQSTTTATGVIRLYLSEHEGQWMYAGTGVVMLVRDASRRSYFIRFIALDGSNFDYEEEIYRKMAVDNSIEKFISFEGEFRVIGLSFADSGEAFTFYTILQNRLTQKRTPSSNLASTVNTSIITTEINIPSRRGDTHGSTKKSKKEKSPKMSKKNAAAASSAQPAKGKLQIGAPEDFRHVNQLSPNNDENNTLSCFDDPAQEDKWVVISNGILNKDPKELNEKEKQKVYTFVEQNGGIEIIYKFFNTQERVVKKNNISISSSSKSDTSSSHHHNKKHDTKHQSPVEPPKRMAPGKAPPKPPRPTQSPISSNKSSKTSDIEVPSSAPPPPPPIAARPKVPSSAPPPPPPPSAAAPPPPPTMSKPPPPTMSKPPPPSAAKPDSPTVAVSKVPDRGSLLGQIQTGTVLKKINVEELKRTSIIEEGNAGDGGLFGALAQNLSAFRDKMQIGDDSDSEEDADFDDWDD